MYIQVSLYRLLGIWLCTCKTDQLQGSLEILTLKALVRGPNSGYAIAGLIERASDDVLRVEEGTL